MHKVYKRNEICSKIIQKKKSKIGSKTGELPFARKRKGYDLGGCLARKVVLEWLTDGQRDDGQDTDATII